MGILGGNLKKLTILMLLAVVAIGQLSIAAFAQDDSTISGALAQIVTLSDGGVDDADVSTYFTVTSDNSSGWTYDGSVISIADSGIYTITGDSEDHSGYQIAITAGIKVTLTLENVSISNPSTTPMLIGSGATVTLNLTGENSLISTAETYAGLQLADTESSLTITSSDDNGSLSVTGGKYGAGIGGGKNISGANITIKSGSITAQGGSYASGIGGGAYASGEKITIEGGTITAQGGVYGAGIGGGYHGGGEDIVISGGKVDTTAGANVAGIGGGYGVSAMSTTYDTTGRNILLLQTLWVQI